MISCQISSSSVKIRWNAVGFRLFIASLDVSFEPRPGEDGFEAARLAKSNGSAEEDTGGVGDIVVGIDMLVIRLF